MKETFSAQIAIAGMLFCAAAAVLMSAYAIVTNTSQESVVGSVKQLECSCGDNCAAIVKQSCGK